MLMCKFSESVKLGGVKNDTGRKVDIKSKRPNLGPSLFWLR